MKRIAVWGWWQGKNLGDNWIKETMKSIFPYADFITTSQHDFSEYDFVICGGGGLYIFDAIIPWINYDQETPFGMIGLGAEFPHTSSQVKQLYDKAAFFYVRDLYSRECMGIPQAERSYDITFSKPLEWVSDQELRLDQLLLVWREPGKLLENDKFCEYIQYEDVFEKWENVIRDNFKKVCINDFYTEENGIEKITENIGFVISGRYHGIVAAIQKGIPFIAIDICPKIRALTHECGLEKYCIKISEVGKLHFLIEEAQKEVDQIRSKERVYREQAINSLFKQISDMKLKIYKQIKPIKLVHYGSYWMRENDVVNVMADDLAEVACVKKVDLKAYSAHRDNRIKSMLGTKNGCICVLDEDKISDDIDTFDAEAVILNSGGLTMDDNGFKTLTNKGVVTVGIELSDPDVYPYNGKIYADKFDIFLTNSRYSLENEYNQWTGNVLHMPFAASAKHHYYMGDIEKKYDVVIVGHAREERIELVDKLSEICKVGTYGSGWRESLGTVNGIEHVKAINSGQMYLSFSKTVAGYDNIKVGLFEAMACKQVVITSYMPELENYFEIGKEILCYKDEQELLHLVKFYLENPMERETIRNNAYRRFLNEHTYEKRWIPIVDKIMEKYRNN